MKPPPFDYEAPETLDAAIALLAGDEDAKALAGGQSLVPLLSLRLTYPSLLVDLRRVPGLDQIEQTEGSLVIGAMTRQRAAELDDQVRESCPLLSKALTHVAHPQIRSRGTVGGSIAHADPASELPATMLALGGKARIAGPGGSREVDAEALFTGLLTTALEPGELITAIELPTPPANAGSACVEVTRRRGDYAQAGCVALVELEGGSVADSAIALFGIADRPVRAPEVEQAIAGLGPAEAAHAAADAATRTIEPGSDPELSDDYRLHLVGVVVRRAVEQAAKEAK